MRDIIEGNGNLSPRTLEKQMFQCHQARIEVSKRIEIAQSLKAINNQSNNQKIIYITEPNLKPPVVCGFNVHPPSLPRLQFVLNKIIHNAFFKKQRRPYSIYNYHLYRKSFIIIICHFFIFLKPKE